MYENTRIIARLDIKGENVVKGINLEGIRPVGKPDILANKYYKQGVDEIIYMDVVASLYGRNSLVKYIKVAAKNIFVPLTVGGGIRNIDDIKEVLNNGADKVAINTAAIKNPGLIKEASEMIGSQSIILSIEAKKQRDNSWEAYFNNGREKSGINVIDWIEEAEKLGAGEILLTSVDNEGLKRGMDIKLLEAIKNKFKIPLIFAGGVGNIKHIKEVREEVDAIAIASILHYEETTISEIKDHIQINNYEAS